VPAPHTLLEGDPIPDAFILALQREERAGRITSAQRIAELQAARRGPNLPPAIFKSERKRMSILGDILRAPASAPGRSSSLGGDLVQFGAELLGGWVSAKTQAKRAKAAAKAARGIGTGAIYYDPRITYGSGGNGMAIVGGGISPAEVPLSTSAAPYVEASYTPALYTQASAVGPLVGGAVAAGRALVATPMVRAAIAWLQQNGLSAAAAAAAVAGLVQGGIIGGTDGPYANPKHNKCTGIMRGDVMAVRRVKRQGKRLLKVLRQAGVGGRRSAGRFRSRRKAC